MRIKVIVAAHKRCAMPPDELYLPLQAGAALHDPIGFERDDSGDNISEKNGGFCELTCLYWAWKNLQADYIGLAHYRRHFRGKAKQVLTLSEAEKLLGDTDIVVTKRRRYYIENLYDHYAHTHAVKPLDTAGQIISEKYPDYLPEFERLKKRTSAHMFNMMVLRRDHLDAYCTWLFDILFELERRVDATAYDAFHGRFFGRVSELLLDVWLSEQHLDVVEVPVIGMEKTNWLKKGGSFLVAKFFGKKYDKSF